MEPTILGHKSLPSTSIDARASMSKKVGPAEADADILVVDAHRFADQADRAAIPAEEGIGRARAQHQSRQGRLSVTAAEGHTTTVVTRVDLMRRETAKKFPNVCQKLLTASKRAGTHLVLSTEPEQWAALGQHPVFQGWSTTETPGLLTNGEGAWLATLDAAGAFVEAQHALKLLELKGWVTQPGTVVTRVDGGIIANAEAERAGDEAAFSRLGRQKYPIEFQFWENGNIELSSTSDTPARVLLRAGVTQSQELQRVMAYYDDGARAGRTWAAPHPTEAIQNAVHSRSTPSLLLTVGPQGAAEAYGDENTVIDLSTVPKALLPAWLGMWVAWYALALKAAHKRGSLILHGPPQLIQLPELGPLRDGLNTCSVASDLGQVRDGASRLQELEAAAEFKAKRIGFRAGRSLAPRALAVDLTTYPTEDGTAAGLLVGATAEGIKAAAAALLKLRGQYHVCIFAASKEEVPESLRCHQIITAPPTLAKLGAVELATLMRSAMSKSKRNAAMIFVAPAPLGEGSQDSKTVYLAPNLSRPNRDRLPDVIDALLKKVKAR